MRSLTREERALIDALGACASDHAQLPEVHPCDSAEFVRAIHQAQNIVLSRPAVEAIADEGLYDDTAMTPYYEIDADDSHKYEGTIMERRDCGDHIQVYKRVTGGVQPAPESIIYDGVWWKVFKDDPGRSI